MFYSKKSILVTPRMHADGTQIFQMPERKYPVKLEFSIINATVKRGEIIFRTQHHALRTVL